MNGEVKNPQDQWPGVLIAYDFVLPSYQWMTSRLEATVARIQTLMTFAATITLGFPVLRQAIDREASFVSLPFALAVACFLALMTLGNIARDVGDMMFTNPGKLYDRSLHLEEWEFKRDAIYYAGICFSHNSALANRKARLGRIMSCLLLVEVLAFLFWIAKPIGSIAALWGRVIP
jgi:hypothetical protein